MKKENTINILLIEDDHDHAELAKRALQNLDNKINITHLKNGERAIEYLQLNSNKAPNNLPDLILLDLRLPGIDGKDILIKIKKQKNLKAIPVIILTTSGFSHDKEIALLNGADSYIVKPLNINNFKIELEKFGYNLNT